MAVRQARKDEFTKDGRCGDTETRSWHVVCLSFGTSLNYPNCSRGTQLFSKPNLYSKQPMSLNPTI